MSPQAIQALMLGGAIWLLLVVMLVVIVKFA